MFLCDVKHEFFLLMLIEIIFSIDVEVLFSTNVNQNINEVHFSIIIII